MQVWQWVRYGAVLDDGRRLTADKVALVVQEELDKLRQQVRCSLSLILFLFSFSLLSSKVFLRGVGGAGQAQAAGAVTL